MVSFVLTALLGAWLIPYLRKLKFGQTILDIGPRWHKNKQGTPTMGGIMFIVGIGLGVLTGYALMGIRAGQVAYNRSALDTARIVLGLVMALAFGMIGFLDDYIKVIKKQNLGLSARQKLIGQFLCAGVYILGLYLAGNHSTIEFLPFMGQFNFGLAYYPLAIIGIVYIVNAVNLTDGIDGLCASVTFVAAIGYIAISTLLYSQGMSMFAAALAGGCVGFLVWNLHPARVFMGDTGSMFLGGCIVALAFGTGTPVFVALTGFVYILEGLSVMLQTLYFKYTRHKYGEGRRIFKMAPIHHHFEMMGWSESRIVAVFSCVGAATAVAAVLAVTRM